MNGNRRDRGEALASADQNRKAIGSAARELAKEGRELDQRLAELELAAEEAARAASGRAGK